MGFLVCVCSFKDRCAHVWNRGGLLYLLAVSMGGMCLYYSFAHHSNLGGLLDHCSVKNDGVSIENKASFY